VVPRECTVHGERLLAWPDQQSGELPFRVGGGRLPPNVLRQGAEGDVRGQEQSLRPLRRGTHVRKL